MFRRSLSMQKRLLIRLRRLTGACESAFLRG